MKRSCGPKPISKIKKIHLMTITEIKEKLEKLRAHESSKYYKDLENSLVGRAAREERSKVQMLRNEYSRN